MSAPASLVLQAQGVGYRYPDRPDVLFRDLDAALYAGDRLAIVGANGSGKTTLLRVLLGDLAPTEGVLSRRPARIAWLRQEDGDGAAAAHAAPHATSPAAQHAASVAALHATTPAAPPSASRTAPDPRPPEPVTAWRRVLAARPELAELHGRARALERLGVPDPLAYAGILDRYEELGGYRLERRVRAEADALGLPPGALDRTFDALSGGERRLLALLGALVDPPDLLALDEPTNYLDGAAIEWLVDKLRAFPGACLVVAHDRWFLDRVVTEVLEIERGSVRRGRGTYSAYAAAREADRKWREREKARHEREIAELREAARGYGVWAGRKEKEKSGAFDKGFIGARAARLQKRAVALRDRALAHADELEAVKPWVDKRRLLAFEPADVPGGTCLVVRGIRHGSLSLPDLDVAWGDRVVLEGPNGCGKTTLLRIAVGEVAPDAGRALWGRGARIGYLPQRLPAPDPAERVADAFAADEEPRARTLLGALAVRGAAYGDRLAELSEGQRRKVALVRCVLDRPNVLVLDEPTSHLDVPSVEMLERALVDFGGTVLLVTHDRYLRERIAWRSVRVDAAGRP